MALRQTYLSLKDKLPTGAESVLVMRGRGNDELAPSADLLAEFNAWKARFVPDSGYETAYHFAWAKSGYEDRFRRQILGDRAAITALKALVERAQSHDIFLICYEAYDKPCHRNLLLQIAEKELGATVDYTPYFQPTTAKLKREADSDQPRLF